MPEKYDKKCVIVTGSSRGIGAATVKEFAKKGYNVVINYVNNQQQAEKLKYEIEHSFNVIALTIKADISNEKEVEKLLELTIDEFGHIDCLVNNAGIAIDTSLEDKTIANFHKILDTNLLGPFLTCKHIGNYMFKQGHGSIVNISSTNGIDSFYPYSMDYDASKAGLISLNHNFALTFAPKVNVNCIAPGWVNTQMNKELDDDYKQKECEHILLGRFAEPEEIAKFIVTVSETAYLNDSIIKIDGGRC